MDLKEKLNTSKYQVNIEMFWKYALKIVVGNLRPRNSPYINADLWVGFWQQSWLETLVVGG
jgi:hypothetical protein